MEIFITKLADYVKFKLMENMSIIFAATYPERTAALVMYGAHAKRAWANDHPFGWKDEDWASRMH